MRTPLARFIIISLLICLSGNLYAQENFIAGSITTLNGDTVKGLIDYRNWLFNPSSISFKSNDNNSTVNYKANEIRSFKVLDEIYIGGIFKVNNSPTKVESLSDSAGFTYRTDTIFIQTLVQGRKRLYYYKDKREDDHLFIFTDSVIQELLYKRYMKYEYDISKILENKRFVGQLTLYLNDCENIRSKLPNLQYNKTDVYKLFQYYLKCTNTSNDFEKQVEKTKVEIGVMLGLCISKLVFEGSSLNYLNKVDFPGTSNLTGGVYFNFVMPRNHERLSIYSDLIFTSYSTSGVYTDYTAGMVTWPRETYTEIGYSYIKLNLMLRYKFKLGKTFLFLNGGMSNSYAVSETNYKKVTYMYYSNLVTEEGKALEDTRKYEQGFVLGLGNQYKKYSFELRMEKGNGMSKYADLTSATTRNYFLLGYKF